MATPKNPNVFFVGINDTKDLKRALIESTKDTIVFMQKYETVLKIRAEKNEHINHLKELVKEITKMVSGLKSKLPESEIHRKLGSEEISIERQILEEGLKQKREVEEKKSSSAKKTVKTEKNNNSEEKNKAKEEMEKLESQLKELENRLKGF